jgi:hypothetical protein
MQLSYLAIAQKAARGLARICGIGMGGVRFEKSKSGWRFFEYCGELKSMQDLPGPLLGLGFRV